MPKKQRKVKHVPQRTCVGCRDVLPKRLLIRIVRTPEGIIVDPTGKLAGRGAYLHNQRECWQFGLGGSLANALRVELTPEDRERLTEFMTTLSDELSSSLENKQE